MRKYLAVFCIMIMLSCSSGDSEGNAIEYARQAVDQKDFAYAKKVCDELYAETVKNVDDNKVESLCDLSLLYMKIAEDSDYDTNMGCAVKCFREAYEADSMQAAAYFDSVVVDDMTHWALMSSIVNHSSHQAQEIDLDQDEMKYVNEADSSGLIP